MSNPMMIYCVLVVSICLQVTDVTIPTFFPLGPNIWWTDYLSIPGHGKRAL